MEQIILDLTELQTGHYKSMLHAFGVALTRAKSWTQNGIPVGTMEMYRYAQTQEDVPAPAFFLVSAEGAVGLCSSGLEYEVKWLFLPVADDGLNTQIAQAQEAAVAATPAPTPTPAPAAHLPKFCPNCGTPYKSDASKFCSACGTPRKM